MGMANSDDEEKIARLNDLVEKYEEHFPHPDKSKMTEDEHAHYVHSIEEWAKKLPGGWK